MIIIVQYNCHESGSWAHAHSPHCLLHHSTAAHPPWTAFPIHHCTSHTAVTNHSLAFAVYTPVPGPITCTGVPHSLPYLSSLHTYTHGEVLFCPGWHSEHYSCFCDRPVYDPGLFTPVDSLLPALVILLLEVPIVLLPALTPARYCLRLCLASDISDTDGWSLPVWPCLSLLKQDCKWIHTPQTLRYNNTVHWFWQGFKYRRIPVLYCSPLSK